MAMGLSCAACIRDDIAVNLLLAVRFFPTLSSK